MNIPSANDDEDFPVFKAGPPLPIRTRTKSHSRTKYASNSGTQIPLKATSGPLKGHASSRHQNILVQSNGVGSNNSIPAIASSSTTQVGSKVKQYIERVKASDEIGRRKRVKAEQMLSLEDLYQVGVQDHMPDHPENLKAVIPKSSSFDQELTTSQVQEKLRETLRIVKEKDELINKLRESCHDLAIKCADAENRVDELRFSYGRSSSTGPSKENHGQAGHQHHHRGSLCGEPCRGRKLQVYHQPDYVPRRCVSDECLHKYGLDDLERENADAESKQFEKQDKSTETAGAAVTKHDVQTQIELTLCQDGQTAREVGHWQAEDEILQETCSNWMEKVQNWKTDSNFNLSQDSGGDRDSGFRGSAEIDIESIQKQQRHYLRKKCHEHGERLLKAPTNNPAAQLPQMSLSSSTTATAPKPSSHSNQEEESSLESRHFWPSFSCSQSNFHLNHYQNETLPSTSTRAKSLFYEIAESERNKCSYFQEGFTTKHNNHRHHNHHRSSLPGTKSLDALYLPPPSHQSPEELRSLIDSSFELPESILKTHLSSQQRSIDKKVKMLDPLLDDATQIALRVQKKSERLAKMLQDACTFD